MPNIGSLNVTHNFAGNAFNYVIMQLVKSTTPLAEIARVVYPAPFSQQTHLFENLQPVWHLIRFWSSTDGVTLDTEVLTIAGNARSGALYPISTYEYVVGRGDGESGVWADPVQDDTGIRDTRLAGAMYWIEERGTGSLLSNEFVDRTDAGGGWDFTEVGKIMNTDGVYIVRAIERIDVSGDSGSGDIAGAGFYLLIANEDYNSSLHSGKTLLASFSGTIGTLTMPNLSLVSDGSFKLLTHTGSQRNVVIQLDAGDTVRFRKADVNKIILGEGEEIEIVIQSGTMYVIEHNTNHERLGTRFWSDLPTTLNTLIANGQQLNQADYPRAVELLDSLPGSAVVSYTTWDTSQVMNGVTRYPHKGKFARDDVGGTFRVPDMRSQMVKALSATDGSQIAGRYENQEVLNHRHHQASLVNVNGVYMSVQNGSGGNLGYALKGSNVDNTVFMSSLPKDDLEQPIGDDENLVNNIGLYPLICI